MIPQLEEELDRVGARIGLPWWNASLLKDPLLLQLLVTAVRRREEAGMLTDLGDLFPLAEYQAMKVGLTPDDVFSSHNEWRGFIASYHEALQTLLALHSMQACTPQHGALLLDYMARERLLAGTTNIVIELGCSAGLLGAVFEHYTDLFSEEGGEWAKEHYFFLKRWPMVPPPVARITYIGVDYAIPPVGLMPYFIDDPVLRGRLRAFANDLKPAGLLVERSLTNFLDAERLTSGGTIVIVTAQTLKRFRNPRLVAQHIMRLVTAERHVHWLDISDTNVLFRMMGDEEEARASPYDETFLSHDGIPVARIKGKGAECNDWEYL